ncbi:hypothetical protein BKA66DRAFT_509939 [Pyrenochaeta sp. MPI-SDFR-AT-0127]|nr:hypothetical protein BKA66DRAFT_509939 [Pyrenochaeta sp. MPI-SDFR-AT-0127]
MAHQWITGLLALQALFGLTTAQVPSVWKPYDVVTYYCSRWYHQAVVKNDVLYLYGGIQTFNVPNLTVKSTNNSLGYNPFLLEVDLTKSWDWKTNITWIALEIESNPRTGDYVRHAMTSGAMYHGPYNTSSIWTYSGTTFRGNTSFLNSDKVYTNQYPLFSFDNATQNWNQFDLGQLRTPSYGLSAEAPDQGLAFYMHGQTDNGTEPYTRTDGDTTTLLNGMMVIDLVHQTAKNISTSSMKDPQPRVGGSMQYVPGIGNSGVMLALGGRVYDGLKTPSSQDKGRLLTFDTVDVFDIASYRNNPEDNGTWYQQSTSGEIPPPRIDTCTVIGSAPDNSSHNIYMFGGWDPTLTNTWYDDVYVLSLPSFTWVKMYYAESPRYGHTCHTVGRQMITTGGRNIRRNITDYCDWELHGIAVLDMPTMTWGSVFNATYGDYEVSNMVVDKIGGTPQGGDPRRIPASGWSSPEFGALMNSTRIYSNLNGTLEVIRYNTSKSGLDSRTRTAIIAGVTVTVVVLLICASWLFYLYRKRRNHAKRAELSADQDSRSSVAEIHEKTKYELSPDEKPVYEMKGEDWRYEAPDTLVRAEADRANITSHAVELPATNFGEHGRWGVPFIKLPTPSASRRGSAATVMHSLRISSRRGSENIV